MALRAVYSVQIASLFPALPSQSYTVPDGVKWVVRDIDAAAAAGSGLAQLLIHNAASGVLVNFQATPGSVGVSAQWQGRQVFNPGEFLEVSVASGTWSVQISGYELTLT